MSKAEEQAKEYYQFRDITPENYREYKGFIKGFEKGVEFGRKLERTRIGAEIKDHECDVDLREEAYMKGYTAGVKEQLTWKDVKCIVEIADYLLPHMKIDEADLLAEFQTEEMYYKKVLKMYNDGKE